jgi:hypothetical protein
VEPLEERTLLAANLYTFFGSGTDLQLASVDWSSANVSLIGPTGISGTPGLDFAGEEEVLYGGSSGELKKFDILTGEGSVIGTITVDDTTYGTPNNLHSIAFSPDGRLFAATNGTDALYEIDPLTAKATLIGPLGINLVTSGMDFAPDGTLYLIEGGANRIYTVDTGAGNATLLGPLGINPGAVDLAIADDGTIYGSGSGVSGYGNALFTVDPTTGAATVVGSMGAGVWAQTLAWATETVGVDVKPDSDPNSINLKSKGVLPIAVLTDGDFDATSIDTTDLSTIRMGDVDFVEHRVSPIRAAHDDVDSDGDMDLILHFSMPEIVEAKAITSETVEVEIIALSLTNTGPVMVTGTDAVRVVQPKGQSTEELQALLVDYALADLGENDNESIHTALAEQLAYDQLDEPA